ncbi:hypothetical protein [Ktedonospora formicarum]|uniref:Uncharacterized protein n=1 Tax=Ktedonospora formicarum TaxID=2778364 RepID=A0A8J3MWC2_9CHLR|nr:hypothetical protein [Ktedonospora formicarum]GHO48508.1 hypothetical protein KSX_66710 [Ktedonospora formicarum]
MTYGFIKAKETVYAGKHFRSRIEARWAVVFTTLAVTWRYEPQHYDFGRKRPWLDDEYEFREYVQEALYENTYDDRSDVIRGAYQDRYERHMYLPDFYLPEFQHWVEIKGKTPTYDERSKATHLTWQTKQPITIIWGNIPGPNDKWGEATDIINGEMNIIALFAIECGVKAVEKAFTTARQFRFMEHP